MTVQINQRRPKKNRYVVCLWFRGVRNLNCYKLFLHVNLTSSFRSQHNVCGRTLALFTVRFRVVGVLVRLLCHMYKCIHRSMFFAMCETAIWSYAPAQHFCRNDMRTVCWLCNWCSCDGPMDRNSQILGRKGQPNLDSHSLPLRVRWVKRKRKFQSWIIFTCLLTLKSPNYS